MGLSFLNKKQVHPGTFGNMESVWKAERDYENKVKKALEREKKLKEERQIEEIRRLKVEAGLMPKNELERLDFIYTEGPQLSSSNNIKTKNDFFSNFNNTQEENKENKEKKNLKVSQTVDCEKSFNPQNELFTRVHEDPLFIIKKEEMKRKQEIESNPYQMKLMLKEIERELLDEEKTANKRKEQLKKQKSQHKSNCSEEIYYQKQDEVSKRSKNDIYIHNRNNNNNNNNYKYNNNYSTAYSTDSVKHNYPKEGYKGYSSDYYINQSHSNDIQKQKHSRDKEKGLEENNDKNEIIKKGDENIRSKSIMDFNNSKEYGLFGGSKENNSSKDKKFIEPDLKTYNKKQAILEELNKFKMKNK